MPTSLIQPEFKVEIDYDKCHKCGRCVQQCGWGVYSFNERPFPTTPSAARVTAA